MFKIELLVNIFAKKHVHFTIFSNYDISNWQLTVQFYSFGGVPSRFLDTVKLCTNVLSLYKPHKTKPTHGKYTCTNQFVQV